MTRGNGLGTAVLGACLALVLGCRHTRESAHENPVPFVPAEPAQIRQESPVTGHTSPYHPRGPEIVPPRETVQARVEVTSAESERVVLGPPPVILSSATHVEVPPREGPPVVEALHCLLQNRPEEARRWLDRYEPPNREALNGLLGVVVLLAERQLQQADPQDIAAIQGKLEAVLDRLRPRAALTLTKLRFCKWIEKYGDYEPLADNHQYRAGDLVQVYVELRNVTCEKYGPLWQTRLASSIELVDSRGELVWRRDLGDRDEPERSHTARREYFRNCRFYVPDHVPPGLYTLRIHVKDLPTGRTARGGLDFRLTTVPTGRSS